MVLLWFYLAARQNSSLCEPAWLISSFCTLLWKEITHTAQSSGKWAVFDRVHERPSNFSRSRLQCSLRLHMCSAFFPGSHAKKWTICDPALLAHFSFLKLCGSTKTLVRKSLGRSVLSYVYVSKSFNFFARAFGARDAFTFSRAKKFQLFRTFNVNFFTRGLGVRDMKYII